MFSKKASNQLPLYRTYNHKIQLENADSLNDIRYSPLYYYSAVKLEEVKWYIIKNLDKGFINTSQTPFVSSILFVKKKDGNLQFCINYRKLNNLTYKDQYLLPLISKTLARITRAKIFTKLDIRQAFHRIRISPESEELMTFWTRYKAYKCKVLPFSLTNGLATYQRYINNILFDYLNVFCTTYLNNILIYSKDLLKHKTHVKLVLERLREAKLQVNIKKSEFKVTRTKYLGFVISTAGIKVNKSKTKIIKN
jgi:hypothetical protein